jgi:hypothetical protein
MDIIVGQTTFLANYCDSDPLWEVVNDRGNDSYDCRIMPDQVGEGTQRVFGGDEIQRHLKRGAGYSKAMRAHYAYYDSLQTGDQVHYHDGFGKYVRCVVAGEGRRCLKPIALVGKWGEDAKPSRDQSGRVCRSYWADKIRTGEMFEPSASTIWENPKSAQQGKTSNPPEMEPIDLSLPEPSEGDKLSMALHQAVRDVCNTDGGDPVVILTKMRERIDWALCAYATKWAAYVIAESDAQKGQ